MYNNPCHHCTERIVGCHSTCERYKKFREDCEKIRKEKERDIMWRNHKFGGIFETSRKRRFFYSKGVKYKF